MSMQDRKWHNQAEYAPMTGTSGPMFETRLSLIGFAPDSHKLTARNYLLDYDVADHLLPDIMEMAGTRQGRHLPSGMREETGRRQRSEHALDLVTSRRIPTRIVYALEPDNWSFTEEIPAFVLRNYDNYPQFWDLKPVSRKDGKIKAISLQYLNAVGSPYDVTLNIAVEQPGIGRMLRTLIKLHPRIINAS